MKTTSAAKANRNADIVDRLEAEIERLHNERIQLDRLLARYRAALEPFCTADWYAYGGGKFQGIVHEAALDEAKTLLGMMPARDGT